MPKTIGQAKEREIVRLHERGKPPVEIADAVGVNPATVKRLSDGGRDYQASSAKLGNVSFAPSLQNGQFLE